ncbi:MAG: aminotransferase class V-fold PLP-dependent enzyme [Rhodobacteraceae bacterium]|jgi:alanine-glyoxylate transaminase/serine-glyoxylate transaminase/serine-pyruvate transaminase|nr:aminotransferase class V-fold PLP-dependent enzyme [Paracoccaceae bacterium]
MPFARGRPYLAIPGPTVVPDRVLAAMHRPAPDIYGAPLQEMAESLYPDLRHLAGTTGHVAIYIGNGHAGWEAANANVFSRGDRALVLVGGHFGLGWANALRAIGVEVEALDLDRRSAPDPGLVEAALRADRGGRIRAVLTTHVDTATSVRTDIADLRAAIDAAGHPALLMVDCIASMGCDRYRMDDWGVDVTVAASQKGLMTPPGLAVLWFSEKARAAGRDAGLRTPYWAWEPRALPTGFWQRWAGTAPTHHLFGLREALTMLVREEGIEAAWSRHAALAGAVWAAAEVWSAGGALELNVHDRAARAHGVTALSLPPPLGARLREWTERVAGVTLGIGIGQPEPAAQGHFRIAHMGHVNAHMVMGVLGVVEAGLAALGVPRGAGALEAAAAALAAAAARAG